jgi:hypothetical protein
VTDMHDAFILEPADPAPMPWWRTVTARAFAEKIRELSVPELQRVAAEMDGDVAVLNSERQARGRENDEWWRRATRVQGFITRKRKLVSCELNIRNDEGTERRKQKHEALAVLLELAKSGDLQAALVGLLEHMHGHTDLNRVHGKAPSPEGT